MISKAIDRLLRYSPTTSDNISPFFGVMGEGFYDENLSKEAVVVTKVYDWTNNPYFNIVKDCEINILTRGEKAYEDERALLALNKGLIEIVTRYAIEIILDTIDLGSILEDFHSDLYKLITNLEITIEVKKEFTVTYFTNFADALENELKLIKIDIDEDFLVLGWSSLYSNNMFIFDGTIN